MSPSGAKREGIALSLLIVVALGLTFGFHRISDPDLFQQIAVGRAILADPGSIGVSSFLDAYPAYPYVADKWLASVAVAWIDGVGGESGLMLYQLGVNLLLGLAWFAALRRHGTAPAFAALGVALIFLGCAFRTDPRPDTLSQILLAWVVGRFGGGSAFPRTCVVFALTMALWVNLHGYFVNGLIVAAVAAAAGGLGDSDVAFGRGVARRVALRRGAVLLLAGTAASCVHPQGLSALVWPLRQLLELRDAPVLREAILEFASPAELLGDLGVWRWGWLGVTLLAVAATNLPSLPGLPRLARARVGLSLLAALPWLVLPPAGLAQWPYRITVALIVLAAFELPTAFRRRRFFALGLLGVFVAMALPLLRNQSLLPPAAMLILAPHWSRIAAQKAVPWRSLLAVGVALAAIWARLGDRIPPGHYRAPEWSGWGFERRTLPVDAFDFVEANGLRGPWLHPFDTGGYLLYRLHPEQRAFIAGNTSMYPPAFLDHYVRDVVAGGVPLEQLVERHGFRGAIVPHAALDTAGLLGRLARSADFQLVYLDSAAAVYLKEAPGAPGAPGSDRELSHRRCDNSRSDPVLPAWLGARRRLYPTLNLAQFFRSVGRPDRALECVEALWSEPPEPALAILGATVAEQAGLLAAWTPRLEQAFRHSGGPELQEWLARALYLRGVESLQSGDLDPAEADLRRSSELAPRSPGPYLARAHLAAAGGDTARARDLLRQALDRATGNEVLEAARADPRLAPFVN